MEERITADFCARKSAEWNADLTAVRTELARVSTVAPAYAATGDRILELAKQAHLLYLKQDPTEQRRLLETWLSNCTFDRGSLWPTYTKPFDVLVRGRETEDWRREWESLKQSREIPMNTGVFSVTLATATISRLPISAGACVCLRAFADFSIAMTLEMALDARLAPKPLRLKRSRCRVGPDGKPAPSLR